MEIKDGYNCTRITLYKLVSYEKLYYYKTIIIAGGSLISLLFEEIPQHSIKKEDGS